MKSLTIGKSKIHGKGVIALENIDSGEKVQYIRGKLVHRRIRSKSESLPTVNWIGAGRDKWIQVSGLFRYINHSCEPNVAIVGKRTVVATKRIRAGEELTMDYALTDGDKFWSIKCYCGVRKCRKLISSVHSLPPKVIAKNIKFIPKYLLKEYEKRDA